MWGQLVDGGTTVLVCPGNHYSMSESPNATVTGSILATALAFKYRLLFPEFPRHTRTFSQRRAVEKLSSGAAVFLHSKKGNDIIYIYVSVTFSSREDIYVSWGGGGVHLQHTRIAVAFAHWNFLLFLRVKTKTKIPAGKCNNRDTRMLQTNPPIDSWILCFLARSPVYIFHLSFSNLRNISV